MRSNFALAAADSHGLSECLDRLASAKHDTRPLATYRLQFNHTFRFTDAERLLPYLRALGITHCYASPILKARTGSMHGYDITNHNAINPEIGTEEEFRTFVAALKSFDMGLILDMVPNHMGVGYGDNPWWQSVLENGQSSPYADFFDIDWHPLKADLNNKVLLPILGNPYGEELEAGRLPLRYQDGRFVASYYEKPLPIDPQTCPLIFEPLGDMRGLRPEIALNNGDRGELENIIWDLRRLPPHFTNVPDLTRRRQQDIPALTQRLAGLTARSEQARKLMAEVLRIANGEPGNPRSYDAMHRLLEAQAYRLAYWRVSAEEINYRRFFDINDLVGLRMENPKVFAETHRLIRKLLADGLISGLRIDHPDGLFNPPQYFTRMQMLYAASQCSGPEPQPPLAENGIELEVQELFGRHDWMHRHAPLYLLVEKILEPGEDLPSRWPVDGTVGYDFANLVNGIFIDGRNERALIRLYRRFIGGTVDVDTLIYQSKKLIMRMSLSSEVTVLSHLLDAISSTDRRARDITRAALTGAIRETIACFPVYRTYIDERGNISERDRTYISEAIRRAKHRNESTNPAIFDFLADVLLLRMRDETTDEAYRQRLYFSLKFQQLTGPVMAKGLEDTTCYVYNPLLSVNEVGGSPAKIGIPVGELHRGNAKRMEHWPYSMLATSTHDTKRGEDVRARINVLSELPKIWATQAMRWRRLNKPKKRTISDGRSVPDHNEEFLLYQTLIGTWPFELATKQQRDSYTQRIQQYMIKAVNEAKVNMSWINPNAEYSDALQHFVARLLSPGKPSRPNVFLEQMETFAGVISFFGAMNSLAQLLLKLTAPGIPDLYQGTELWDLSLVDPDNRRPVDFPMRLRLQQDLEQRATDGNLGEWCDELLNNYQDGRIKLWSTQRALCFRRQHGALFQSGSYVPLQARVDKEQHVVAFTRRLDWDMAVVAVPRLSYTLMGGTARPPIGDAWGKAELELPPHGFGGFENIFTGEVVRPTATHSLLCREVFARFPIALLLAS